MKWKEWNILMNYEKPTRGTFMCHATFMQSNGLWRVSFTVLQPVQILILIIWPSPFKQEEISQSEDAALETWNKLSIHEVNEKRMMNLKRGMKRGKCKLQTNHRKKNLQSEWNIYLKMFTQVPNSLIKVVENDFITVVLVCAVLLFLSALEKILNK